MLSGWVSGFDLIRIYIQIHMCVLYAYIWYICFSYIHVHINKDTDTHPGGDQPVLVQPLIGAEPHPLGGVARGALEGFGAEEGAASAPPCGVGGGWVSGCNDIYTYHIYVHIYI